GRRAGFRILWAKHPWGFKSPLSHFTSARASTRTSTLRAIALTSCSRILWALSCPSCSSPPPWGREACGPHGRAALPREIALLLREGVGLHVVAPDVVALEYAPIGVPRHGHGDHLGDACTDEVGHGRVPGVVEDDALAPPVGD